MSNVDHCMLTDVAGTTRSAPGRDDYQSTHAIPQTRYGKTATITLQDVRVSSSKTATAIASE